MEFEPTVPALIKNVVSLYADRDFLVTPDARLTYAEADRRSQLVAKSLIARGYGKGTRIGFMFGNTPDWVIIWLATSRIGAIAMPLSTLYTPRELQRVLTFADIEVLITPAELAGRDQVSYVEEALPGIVGQTAPLRLPAVPYLRSVLISGRVTRGWAEHTDLANPGDSGVADELLAAIEAAVHPADPMVTIFTSGTTADPKAVVHSHGTFVRHTRNYADNTDEPYGQRVYGGMPFFWIGGLSSTIGSALQRGHTILCAERPDPDQVAALLVQERCTQVMMWPNLFERVLERLQSGRWRTDELPPLITTPPASTVDPARRAQSLGMTETCAGYIVSGPKDHAIPDEYLGAHGFQVPHMQYRIADIETHEPLPEGHEGEICVRGYALMLGMHKRERHEYLDDDGWYYTGDKGSLRGPYIYFSGRVKDLIKSSGANVAPREVEAVLNSCTGVLTSVVVGVPDPRREEIVGAIVAPRLGARLDPMEIKAACKDALSAYKVPRRLLLLPADEFPLLATGKTDLSRAKALLVEQGFPI